LVGLIITKSGLDLNACFTQYSKGLL